MGMFCRGFAGFFGLDGEGLAPYKVFLFRETYSCGAAVV